MTESLWEYSTVTQKSFASKETRGYKHGTRGPTTPHPFRPAIVITRGGSRSISCCDLGDLPGQHSTTQPSPGTFLQPPVDRRDTGGGGDGGRRAGDPSTTKQMARPYFETRLSLARAKTTRIRAGATTSTRSPVQAFLSTSTTSSVSYPRVAARKQPYLTRYLRWWLLTSSPSYIFFF